METLTQSRISVTVDGAGTATASAGSHRAVGPYSALELQLPTAGARVNSPALALQLTERDGRLVGRATAAHAGDATGWLGNYLPYRCELDRS